MGAGISHRARLTIVFLAILAHEANAQDSDELLREFSTGERASIRTACYGAGLLGPARFYTCLAEKADELRRSPGEPSLAEFSDSEQSSIRSACYGAGLVGPARFYTCLAQKAEELRRSPGEPSLAEFSDSEQSSIRSACYRAGLVGPARFYACLAQKADELRTVRRELGLSSSGASPDVADTPRLANTADSVAASPPPAPPAQAPAPSTVEQAPAPTGPVAPAPTPVTSAPAATSRTASSSRINSVVPVAPEPTASVPAFQAPQPLSSSPPRSEDDTAFVVGFWSIVGAVYWAVWYRGRLRRVPSPPFGTAPAAPPPPDANYRPRSPYAGGSGITFTEPRTDTLWNPHEADLTDVRDAITGQTLRPALGLHRCTHCQVFYQTSSVEWLRRENGGRCISCGNASVRPIGDAPASEHDQANDQQDVTTLENYRSRVGQVVVFEGRCIRVLPSRTGAAYAVMFEDHPWTQGFKLVIRTGFVASVGGNEFIRSLAGRTVRARGLITHSPVFGYEITVTTRSMILGVW